MTGVRVYGPAGQCVGAGRFEWFVDARQAAITGQGLGPPCKITHGQQVWLEWQRYGRTRLGELPNNRKLVERVAARFARLHKTTCWVIFSIAQ